MVAQAGMAALPTRRNAERADPGRSKISGLRRTAARRRPRDTRPPGGTHPGSRRSSGGEACASAMRSDAGGQSPGWVTYGLLNLTHRGGHEHPVALTPGAILRCEDRFVAHCSPLQEGQPDTPFDLGKPVADGVAVSGDRHPDAHTRRLQSRAAGAPAGCRSRLSHPRQACGGSQAERTAVRISQGNQDPTRRAGTTCAQDPPPMSSTVPDTGTTIVGGYGLKERLPYPRRRQQQLQLGRRAHRRLQARRLGLHDSRGIQAHLDGRHLHRRRDGAGARGRQGDLRTRQQEPRRSRPDVMIPAVPG